MIFKELRPSLPIFILDKSGMTFAQGKVVNVNGPRINTIAPAQQNPMAAFSLPQMIMDVTIEANGQTSTYQLPENVGATAIGSMLISIDKSNILSELNATKADCEEYLANVDKKKEKLTKCVNLIAELDTAFKDKKAIDDRISAVESQQREQNKKLDKILELLKK